MPRKDNIMNTLEVRDSWKAALSINQFIEHNPKCLLCYRRAKVVGVFIPGDDDVITNWAHQRVNFGYVPMACARSVSNYQTRQQR